MNPSMLLLCIWVGVAGVLAFMLASVTWIFVFGAVAANVTWRIASTVVVRMTRSPEPRAIAPERSPRAL